MGTLRFLRIAFTTIPFFYLNFEAGVFAQLSPNLDARQWILDTSKSDEFNGTALDTVKWWTIDACTFTNGLPHGFNGGGGAFFRPQNVRVNNGSLVLTAAYNPDSLDTIHPCLHYSVYPFYSGGLLSTLINGGPGFGGLGSFSYGYYEMRAKLPGYYDADHNPVGFGFSPSFWFYYQYPGGGCIELHDEVDVLEPNPVEYYDAKTNVVGWHDEDGVCSGYKVGADSMRSPAPLFDDFHTFAVALLPDRIIFYFDDQPFFADDTLTSPGIAHSLKMAPYLAVVIVLGMGGNNVPHPSPTAPIPQFMYVDYFRYYHLNPDYPVGSALSQNSPNPVVSSTDIEYTVDAHAENSFINVYTVFGTLIKSVRLAGKGKSKINLAGSEFSSGVYLYSLSVDNKIIDTKKMVVLK